ncbi:MAG: amino acid adenylation domain-containing protein, partial [Alphaproteobacteria bacterium]
TLDGALDPKKLAAALNDVVARHEALRGSIACNGEALRIVPRLEVALPLHDFSGPDGGIQLKSLLDEEARGPFDLAAGPLLRAHLVRQAPDRHVLVLTVHHIICDGWSMNTVLSELGVCYAARLDGVAADLPAPLRFSAYAKERAQLKPDDQKAEAYWLGEYRDLPPPLELPSDRPRPAVKSFAGATYSDHLDAALVAAVKKAGQTQGATLFATLLAAVQVLLGKLGNETDIALTVPMAAQSLLDEEILVGHAVDFLPVRGKFDVSRSFAAHLAAMKDKLLSAIDHQSYTYGTLVRKLDMPRDPARAPITDVQFNLERFGGELEFAGLKASPKSNPKAFVNFDLFLNLAETGDGINLDVDYATDLYDEGTIRRWIGHLKTLLAQIARDLSRPIAELSLLSADEQRWLIEEVNASAAAFPRDKALSELIEAQAEKTPEATALACKGEALTYAALEKQANRVAAHLRGLLPAGGSRVAVALPRTLDLPVALLAVLKSGNAYVPLDPTHPKARLASTLAAADVSALICADDEMASLSGADIKVVRADRPLPDGLAPLRPKTDPETAAYVIFTSGSTGAPKGVEISHRSVVNLLTSMTKAPGFTSGDTIVAVTTISFDIAGLELFLPLITGGRCVIADRDEVRDGHALARLVEQSGATVLQATPSLWRMMLEAGLATGPHLKMLCGGEALPRDLADRLLANGGELWNVYGPTETTIWSSAGRVVTGDGPIVIGAPVANTEFHILGPDDRLLAPGVSGEVWIGGEGLARGYFNRPDLTAAAFRVIDIGGVPRRLYRTGDVGRRLADGGIQLLGRRDHQIKLRGYRIELEDIEAHVRRAPGVAAAAVALQSEAQGDPRLVGYYVVGGSVEPTPQSLGAHLAEYLPNYMVPTLWQRLDHLPLTANGKLDRKNLPRVVAAPAAMPAAGVEDPSEVGVFENTVAETWASLLGVEKVGPDTNFFEAGGHSILAMRLMARLQDALQRPMPVGDLYKYPRFGDFLGRIKQSSADSQTSKIIRIQPKGSRPPLIVLNNAWNLFPLSRALEEDRPLISIQFVDRTVSEPKNAVPFDEVVGEAIALIRTAQPKGPYALMGHCVLGSIALEAARRLKAEGEEVTLVAMLDSEPNCIFKGIPVTERVANYWVIELRRLRWYFDLWAKGKVNITHILARYALAR